MFSGKPGVLDDGEIISPDETFTWQADSSVTERRMRRKRSGVGVAVVGAMLVLLVLGIQTGLFSSWAATTW
jgi:hypothetical protein